MKPIARVLLRILLAAACFGFITLASLPAFAQGTGATGSIQGTVTDPGGAVIPNAPVEISNKATGRVIQLHTNNSGAYNSGALIPGDYVVKVNASGFAAVEMPLTVQVNVTSNGNVKVGLTAAAESVTVEGQAVRINTEQATVQGVLTTEQIDTLPINGRNFLDLAQLEPGVQIQDGSNFDPTKGGFSGISIGGRSGRTTRVELDGQDITDETVGTVVSNVAAEGIQEFDISQSSLDLSTELTSSGSVNVSTRTGTNAIHGEGFYLFRDKALSANFPGGVHPPYQRNHQGGRLGGPIVKDKLFFFLSGEHIKQVLGVPVNFPGALAPLSGVANQPFHEREGLARLDWQVNSNIHAFYRINYDIFSATSNTANNYSIYHNLNNTPAHVAGVDFATGSWSHSIRVGYLKFQNHISDATGSGVPNPIPGAQIRVSSFREGPNPLAPQATFQTNKQFKYDGSKVWGTHIIRYGVGFNRILGGGFANFFGLGPSIRSTNSAKRTAKAATGPFPGGAANPLNYPVSTIVIGNGQGFFTEAKGFGLPAGGQFDSRLQWYLGDSWKIHPNLTFTYGVRYVRDTGRTNSDIKPLPCSDIDTTLFSPAPPCNGNLLDLFGPGLSKQVRQDNNNFAPTVGLVWDPASNGKLVFRAGAGMYYENAIFNNVLFSRPLYLQKGLFNNVAVLCGGNGTIQFPNGPVTSTPGGLDILTQVCGQPIGSVASEVIALQNSYIAATRAAGAALNPQFVGETLNPNGLLAPNYRSPYSFQMNAGIQYQVSRGTVFSADYIRNVNLHYLVGIDTNHVGDSRFFNKTAALNAINTVNAANGCPAGPAGIDCAIAAGAVMSDYGDAGLGSGTNLGGPASAFGLTPDQGMAFAGINPLVGSNIMYFPSGRSVYNALQFSLRSNATNPFATLHVVKRVNFQASYSLSRFVGGLSNDQDFISSGFDYRNPNRYIGPSTFDRTHQFSFGATFELPEAFQFSVISHVYSPLPSSLFSPSTGSSDDIFVTDFTGDGTTQDPLQGTRVGSYGRDITPNGLATFLTNYNNTFAGQPTPAGQVLINNGLFTLAQLQTIGCQPGMTFKDAGSGCDGVTQAIAVPSTAPANNGWLKVVDLKLAVPIKIGERFRIEPSAALYNAFNFANYDVSPTTSLSSVLDGSSGSVNGTPKHGDPRNSERATQTSSTFGLGSPRQAEFGLRFTF